MTEHNKVQKPKLDVDQISEEGEKERKKRSGEGKQVGYVEGRYQRIQRETLNVKGSTTNLGFLLMRV